MTSRGPDLRGSISPQPISPQPISPPERATLSRLGGVLPVSLTRALIAVIVLAALLVLTQLGVAMLHSELIWAVVLFDGVFLVWTGAGVLAWWRRPDNGIGPLILIGAVSVYLGGIANIPVPAFELINGVFATSVFAVTVHILHAFPSGRVRGRVSMTTVTSGYLVTIGIDLVTVVIGSASVTAEVLQAVQRVLGLAVMGMTAVVLVHRLTRADRRHRRVLLPMQLYGILAVIVVPLVPFVTRGIGAGPLVPGVIQLALIAGLPIAFLLGVLRGGFRRTTPFEALSAWLAIGSADRPAVAHALATTLGDDTLRVLYAASDSRDVTDHEGVPVDAEPAAPGRGRIDVHVDGRRVGAIDYDARMIGDAAVVRRAAEVLAIALDRERLTVELLASNAELTRSRMRLVEAAFRERSRIARDLHDGLQVQLVLLALEAQTIANARGVDAETSAACAQLRRGIDAAAADLRRLVHNVLPAGLLEQGLAAAAEDLVDRLEMPADIDIEIEEGSLSQATAHTAYFVLAEVLANAVKHSRATAVTVVLRQSGGELLMRIGDDGVGGARPVAGAGLRGLGDRVAAIDGSIEIASEPGAGTVVEVRLPCGS